MKIQQRKKSECSEASEWTRGHEIARISSVRRRESEERGEADRKTVVSAMSRAAKSTGTRGKEKGEETETDWRRASLKPEREKDKRRDGENRGASPVLREKSGEKRVCGLAEKGRHKEETRTRRKKRRSACKLKKNGDSLLYTHTGTQLADREKNERGEAKTCCFRRSSAVFSMEERVR